MKSPGKIAGFILLLAAWFCIRQSQAQQLWGEVNMNRSSVYVGQPVQVTVEVYTSTWFTKGVDPGNVKVNGAFTVYFRSVSTDRKSKGKTFPGVQMIFNVFPFDENDVVFPSLEIHVETPAEGGYKGIARTIKTEERTISVKPVPPGFDRDEWMVTNSLNVNDAWVGDLKNVKVGDVIERRISRSASNTVSELIPPIKWDSLPSVSLYPRRSAVDNHKTKTAISASRTETMRYLFEAEGTVTIPEMVFSWWNPYQNKLYKRTLDPVTVDVKANPDLDMLATMKDSLDALLTVVDQPEDEGHKTIFGLSWKAFLCLLVGVLALLIILYYLVRYLIRRWKAKKAAYLGSELYYFNMFEKAVKHGNQVEKVSSLYRWLDQLDIPEPTASYFARQFGSQTFLSSVEEMERNLANGESIPAIDIEAWKSTRKNFLSPSNESTTIWVNPTQE